MDTAQAITTTQISIVDFSGQIGAIHRSQKDHQCAFHAEKVGVAFVSKGVIPAGHMALFAAHPRQVRAQVGLITLDTVLSRTFEPGCAPVDVRLRQIERLIQLGIDTEVRLDPILPGLTDAPNTLENLFTVLSEVGVRRVALNVLYLRPVLFRLLRERVSEKAIRDPRLAQYIPGVKIRVCDGRFSQTALPKTQREEIFVRATALAEAHGIACHCCGCMNPDISNESCNLTGKWKPELHETEQLPLL
jgi:DNA repair photolyase